MVAAHLSTLSGSVEPARVLDLCAAPGGKATGLSGHMTSAFVVASDVSVARVTMMQTNIDRLEATRVHAVVADALDPPFRAQEWDLVLVDAPCSGLGVLRRRPDARWRAQPDDVDRLAALQRRLLTAAAGLVARGGILAYSVCTLTAAETAGVDNWLVRTGPEFEPLPPPPAPWRPAGRGALLLPQDAGTDGMYLLVLRRKG
jgi:16S rRNA (cytosine967-C5)-methyltransferase